MRAQPDTYDVMINTSVFLIVVSVIVFSLSWFFDVNVAGKSYDFFFFTADGRDLLIVTLLMCVSAISLFFWGWELFNKQRLIEAIPLATIKSVPMGLVRISGRAVRNNPLVTPITERDCVFFKYLIEKNVIALSGNRTEVEEDVSAEPFWLEDSTGRILIEPYNCEPALKKRYFHTESDMHGTRKFSEWYLRDGEYAHVVGYAGKSMFQAYEKKELLHEKLQELKESKEEQLKYDKDGDGKLNEYEWEMAVQSIKRDIDRDEKFNDLGDVSVSGLETEAMIISDRNSAEICGEFKLKGVIFIFGALLLFALAVYLIVTFKFVDVSCGFYVTQLV